jgi:hypothetical protein
MKYSTLKELRDKSLISEAQFLQLAMVISRKIISVFYELRILLYLAVLLLTTGIGILIYKNIGEIGHIISIAALFLLTTVCFIYAFKNVSAYQHERVKAPTPYFDYIVLLGCLLFISVLGYLQFQYNLFDDGLGLTTLATAAFFFYAAYRFDHLGVLSLAITALASFWSISLSPQKWYSGDFFEDANLHNTAIIFGGALSIIAILLDKKAIKQHFTFTYINFCSLMFLVGALSGIFVNYYSYMIYLLILYAGCGLTVYFAHLKKSFLFLLYAFIFGYIGTTFFLTDTILHDAGIWFLYLIASCGGFVFFIIRFKNYFKRST